MLALMQLQNRSNYMSHYNELCKNRHVSEKSNNNVQYMENNVFFLP